MNRRAALLLIMCVGAVAYLSLYPWHFVAAPSGAHLRWVLSGTPRRAALDALLNVGFYIPLGALAVAAFPKVRARVLVAIGLSALISLMIECAQLYLPNRFSSYVDLVTNSLGGAIGASAAAFVMSRARGAWLTQVSRTWRLTSSGATLFGAWCVSQTFPFMPALSLARGQLAIQQLIAPTVAVSEVGVGFIALFVLSKAIDGIGWIAIAFAVVPAQALIVQRSLSVGELIGAALGVLSAKVLSGRGPRYLTAAVFMAWLAMEELRPFQFGAVQPFNWIPFEGLMTGAPETYAAAVFLKLFLYASATWVVRASGGSWRWAVGIPGAILAAGEFLQRWLAGRTPETTDFVILAAAALLMKILEPVGQRQTSGRARSR